jgi:endoglucanase
MKFRRKGLLAVIVSCLLSVCTAAAPACGAEIKAAEKTSVSTDAVSPLHVSGTDLLNESGNITVLRGVSTHGLSWYPQYVNYDAFKTMRDKWGVNTVRLSMYTEEYGGYCSGGDREALLKTIDDGVRYASELNMYAVIDWHILRDGDPNIHKNDAAEFFDAVSAKYADCPNVIYEICNEPNGTDWHNSIRPYAEEIIGIIRSHTAKALILVGTNTWSQDVDQVVNDRLEDRNVMYVMHFYAGTHKDALRAKLQNALDQGLPVFISEFGICDASGSGELDYESADRWMELIRSYHLGYIIWNLSNKAEASALIESGCGDLSGWTYENLSGSGKWFYDNR